MSQEHRFCAEIYARLFPLIDRTKRIAVNPDGNANLPGFPDGVTPPDICFTFCGTDLEIGIEAKIVDGTRVKLEKSQREWCKPECATLIPQLWIVATRTLERCWLLEHAHMVRRAEANQGHSLNLWPSPERQPKACDIDELAMEIIAWARKQISQEQGVT